MEGERSPASTGRGRASAGGRARRSLLAIACCVLAASGAARAEDGPKRRVLLLNSYHPGYPWSDRITSAIHRELGACDLEVELHVEYMDTKRHLVEEVFPHLEALYAAKYAGHRLDVIIASDDNALTFLLSRREKLFPGVPVVFCGINDVDDVRITGHKHIAGIAEDFDVKGTLELALRLHPGTRQVAFVSDPTPTGKICMKRVEGFMGQHRPELTYVALSELTSAELIRALGELPSDTVVFYLHFLRDREGRTYSIKDSVAFVEAHCDVPIYTMWEETLGAKTLGGVVTGGTVQGRKVARMALRILKGEAAEGIGIDRHSPTRVMINYGFMGRFGIEESDLPEGTVFFNKPSSMYARYRRWIWGMGAVLAALLAWIGLLYGNIRRRRRAEAALREAHETLASTVESSPLAIVGLDREAKVTLWSPAAERLFGWSREEAMGRLHPAVLPDQRRHFLGHVARVLSGEPFGPTEVRNVCKDGTEIDVSISSAPIHNGHGEIVGAVGVVEDVTERKRAEQERRELEAKIQHAQKLESLGVLAGGIAHDFNNLLVGVLGNAELALLEMPSDGPLRAVVGEIRDAAVRASELTNQMLAYSGKGQFLVRRIDLNELIRDIGQLLRVSISKNVTLSYRLADDLPAVRADASQVRQVVMNLITNASDAIGDAAGRITLRTAAREIRRGDLSGADPPQEPPAGRYVCLEVADTGCGMDEKTRRRLFEPFFTTKFTGRGLGMAAVLGIVRGHRGAIDFESDPGRGTTFRVLLPACEAELATAEEPKWPEPAETQWQGSGTVLVVDDEAMVCKVAKMMLERMGFAVLTACNGQEGLEVFRRHADEVVAVLLDMTMPRMSGSETFREMRRIRPDVKVVVSSGYSEQDAASQFAGALPTAFLHKPFDMEVMAARFREVVRA